ncbi:MAG TPA: glycosyltransferase family 4 protein [Pirellulales bacterium]|jgi:glycosyltransferase involved in cell wall biosynthesis
MSRVLLLFEYATLNGGEQSLLALLQRLTSRGFSFHALAPGQGSLARELMVRNVEVLPLEAISERHRSSQEALRQQISAAIERVRPALVHANSLSMGRLAGPVAASASVPSVAHLRDIIRLSNQAIADLNQNTRLLAVSQATRDHHIAQGLCVEKVSVLYNGIDLAKFQPRPATGWLHCELGLPRDAILIGTVGQLVLRKGHDVLAAAAQSLANHLPHAHYIIVGERYSTKAEAHEHEREVCEQSSTGQLAGRVHFLGYRADVPSILPELTLLAHPARQEPLGRVLLEAAATGIPIVATDVGGTAEILPPGAALLVPSDDPAALATAIRQLVDDPILRQRLAAAALERIRTTFDASTAADWLAKHYAATISSQSDTPQA